MKTVQVLFDEDLLAELDKTAEVHEKGRSAVLRQLATDFVRQRREREIDAQYERAYAGVEAPLGKGFEGWEEEGTVSLGKMTEVCHALQIATERGD
jgi:predicted transcriptional regulator